MEENAQVERLLEAIDEGYRSEERGEARQYIGASMAGTECIAQLALSLRGFPDTEPDPKLKRIFYAGHRIEDWVVYDLKKRADLRVWEKDDFSGRQHSRRWLNGHISCHADGICDFEDGTGKHILEIKSMNGTNWNKFKKHGVFKSHIKYYRQMQMMMAMFRIENSLFVAYNKNTSEYHAQIVPFDQEEWDAMYTRIQAALDGQAGRIAADPDDWRCKSCFKRESCWSLSAGVSPACHFCTHSFANKDGGFTCKLTNKQETHPCDKYQEFRAEPV